jgi:hypothetical protein
MYSANRGLPSGSLETKIFILFLLSRLSAGTPFETLYDLAQHAGGVGYFDFSECLESLVDTGHVRVENNRYSLTDKGVGNIKITEKNLPYSVRLKADGIARVHRTAAARDAMVRTSRIIRRDGGYTVGLSLSDGAGDIISINMFAPNEREAISLEDGFRERAENVYNELIKIIIGA